jgi:hypothetical protein
MTRFTARVVALALLLVPYGVTGDEVGDSLFLHFIPPEDIDLNFGLRTESNRLVGVMWFGTNRAGATIPVTFNRQQ